MIINNKNKQISTHTLICILFTYILLIAADAQATEIQDMNKSNQQKKMLDQLDQLDQLDHQEFVEASDMAYSCIYAHDFACAERKLEEAIKLASSAEDKGEVEVTRSKLASERQIVANEQRLRREEQRRIAAEEERQEELRREEERRARREAEREERANTPSTAELINQFSQNVLKQYSDTLETSRLAGERTRQLILERQAAERESNARIQEQYARQREQDAVKRRNEEQAREQRRLDAARQVQARNQQQADAAQQVQARQQQAEQERQAREQRRLQDAEKAKRESEAREKQQLADAERAERKRLADLEVAKKEQLARDKHAAEEAYLLAVKQQLHLRATHCPGGQGLHYITGNLPKIKEIVDCIAVSYTEYCPGSNYGSSGTIRPFVGGDGCFFEAGSVETKLSCKPSEARVEVTQVVRCRDSRR